MFEDKVNIEPIVLPLKHCSTDTLNILGQICFSLQLYGT